MTDFAPAQELVDELAVALQEAKGISFEAATAYAEPIVRYLQQQHGGADLYIPQPYVRRNVGEIIEAKAAGMTPKEIAHRFGISRRTYYRLLSQL